MLDFDKKGLFAVNLEKRPLARSTLRTVHTDTFLAIFERFYNVFADKNSSFRHSRHKILFSLVVNLAGLPVFLHSKHCISFGIYSKGHILTKIIILFDRNLLELRVNSIEFIFKINYKVMPKGKYLNENKQSQIAALLTKQVIISAIATTIGRSRCVFRNVIDKGGFIGNKKKTKGNTKIKGLFRHDLGCIRLLWTKQNHFCKWPYEL